MPRRRRLRRRRQPSPTRRRWLDISEQKLDAAAKAVKNVSTIRDSYEQKLIKAPADQKAKLADEASDAMEKAVKEQGLSVEEYTTIIEVAQNDPTVRNKLLQRLK